MFIQALISFAIFGCSAWGYFYEHTKENDVSLMAIMFMCMMFASFIFGVIFLLAPSSSKKKKYYSGSRYRSGGYSKSTSSSDNSSDGFLSGFLSSGDSGWGGGSDSGSCSSSSDSGSCGGD